MSPMFALFLLLNVPSAPFGVDTFGPVHVYSTAADCETAKALMRPMLEDPDFTATVKNMDAAAALLVCRQVADHTKEASPVAPKAKPAPAPKAKLPDINTIQNDSDHVDVRALMIEYEYDALGFIRHAQIIGGYPTGDKCKNSMPAISAAIVPQLAAGLKLKLWCTSIAIEGVGI